MFHVIVYTNYTKRYLLPIYNYNNILFSDIRTTYTWPIGLLRIGLLRIGK